MSAGTALLEVTAYADRAARAPKWFVAGEFNRMGHHREAGVSRVYAAVLRDGTARPGDPVVVEPADPAV